MKHMSYVSPFGTIKLVAKDNYLTHLLFPNSRSIDLSDSPESPNFHVFKIVCSRLTDYFSGKPVRFDDLPLEPYGTVFQQSVWQQLRNINYGKTCCYSDIADALANPRIVRAVGGAIGANPIGIIIPCHRVLGKDHALTGFAGGLDIKCRLLSIEHIDYPVCNDYKDMSNTR